MNDNNRADRRTVMSYCAAFDMGLRRQAPTTPCVQKVRKAGNQGKSDLRLKEFLLAQLGGSKRLGASHSKSYRCRCKIIHESVRKM